jgi:predicted transcriptional regulator
MENELTKQEATALFYADDCMGWTGLLSKKMNITMGEVPKLMEKLITQGLVTSKLEKEVDDQITYETTGKGKIALKNYKGKLDV